MNLSAKLLIIAIASTCATGCVSYHGKARYSGVKSAVAVLHPTQGNDVTGTVYFQERDGRVKIVAEVRGLEPNSTHGFHIHEYGDCTAPDGTSAGGHYAPEGHPHAGPNDAKHHAGDLGNVRADANGNVYHEMTVDFISIGSGRNPVLGRAVIVHAKEDDLTSQPTGAAGARLACGVIGVANPETKTPRRP